MFASDLALIVISSIIFIRRRLYDIFYKLHLLLVFGMAACLLLNKKFEGGRQHYVLISLAARDLNFVLCMIRLVYRNIGGRPLSNEWRVDRVHIDEFVNPKTMLSPLLY